MTDFELVKMAMEARTKAYIPYSNHGVGACLVCSDGSIYTGCNVENAGYTGTNCAERTAIFKAVSEGNKSFAKIAIVGGMMDKETLDLCPPCGVCRQVMREFVNPDAFEIILAKVAHATTPNEITEADIETKTYTLSELLPLGFGPENLG